jgi:hypothetical protein
MAYSIIQPPFTLVFREMTKPELKGYFDWFAEVTPERIAGLEAEVRRAPTHSTWRADFSPESLEALGEWFAGQVETRAKTAEEINEVKSKLTFPIDVPGEQLTNRTFSLAMDIGMYFGQVVLKNIDGTKWEQPLRNEKFADYGQPVIMGLGSVPLNPVRIVVMLAYGIMRKKQGSGRLRELYDTWAKMKRS